MWCSRKDKVPSRRVFVDMSRCRRGSRYKHLVETLGDLSLAADVDPDGAAALLNQSDAQDDVDAMLALLRVEKMQRSRAGRCHTAEGDGSGSEAGGVQEDQLAAPCLEFLLEEKIIKLLCELGAVDRPAGTMSLVMGACAALLRQVGYPAPVMLAHALVVAKLCGSTALARARGW